MSEITVASTTDTQRAVELAAGVNDEGTQAEESQPQREAESQQQYVDSADEAESATDKEATTDTTDEAEEQQIPRSARNDKDKGWTDKREESSSRRQKQFDKLTQRIYEQQQELDELKERFNNTGEAPAGSAAARATQANATNDGRPIPAQYRSYDEYVEALAGWKAGQRLQQQKQAELVQVEQERTREVFDTYNEAAQSARTKYEDFEEVVGRRDLKIPQAAQVAIIEAGEAGPDIAYYLGKHPEMCKELARMSPMRAIARIGQIESQVTGSRLQGQDRVTGSSAHRVIGRETTNPTGMKRSTSSAPAPITPVGGSSSRSSVPLGELSYRDYKRVRDQEERRSR